VQVSFQGPVWAAGRGSRLLACGARRGLRRARADEFATASELAAHLIGGEVASADTLAAVDRAHPGAVLIHLEEAALTGVLAILPLRRRGRDALLRGRFDGVRPDPALVAPPAERPAAVYAWGCAARTRAAARAVMQVTAALPEEAYPGVCFFAKAATPAGLRALTDSLGYVPIGHLGLLRREADLRRAA
jgi:hypothetical protein